MDPRLSEKVNGNKYRLKNQYLTEAWQFDPTNEDKTKFIMNLLWHNKEAAMLEVVRGVTTLYINTDSGVYSVVDGMWILIDHTGAVFAMEDHAFQNLYDPVNFLEARDDTP